MFEVLVESAPPAATSLGPRLTSLVVHGGLMALAAAGVTQAGSSAVPKPRAIAIDIYVPPAPGRSPGMVEDGATAPGPIVEAPVAPSVPPTTIPPVSIPLAPTTPGATAQDLARRDLLGRGPVALGQDPAVRLAGEVDEPVTVLTPARPVYPAGLAAAGIAGEVRVEFVVDTSGRCESASVRVVQSSNAAFEASASAAVCEARYRPGRVRGEPVRQLVQQRVTFRQP